MQPYAAPLLEDLEQALEEFDCLVTLKSNDRFFPVWSVAYASSHSLLLTLNADRVYLSYLYVEKLFNCLSDLDLVSVLSDLESVSVSLKSAIESSVITGFKIIS